VGRSDVASAEVSLGISEVTSEVVSVGTSEVMSRDAVGTNEMGIGETDSEIAIVVTGTAAVSVTKPALVKLVYLREQGVSR
jgi:hypothetical protein